MNTPRGTGDPSRAWWGVVARRLCTGALLLATGLPATAQQVALAGVAGGKALVSIDAAAPRFLSPGQTHQGVKLLSVQGEVAVFEVNGSRQTLRVGEAPVSLGGIKSDPGAQRIVLTADAQGHFLPPGQINGRQVQFMVDTGASQVIMSESDATRINLKYQGGQKVRVSTANGDVVGHQIRLDSVRIGGALVYDVSAIVLPQPMAFVLLGNSFLTRFQLQRTNDQLTLDRRY
ncbi:MAG: TIGR02281 family clan AA aspartic protease [Hydrogenophaga sp.]|uniref:retropepsin-like aspartic protease family protein n=1 Tax=Hydrogenophaga sp. TaxID=1904254 RepID=UPI0026115BAF|nr:TIGR02281 family clan AA aspartic protease [Hydrogenophaga sp.]MDM7944415.1 TIGR02281 family clan AA aspartic protease [Hydrogenophaga sp.]